MKKGIIYIIILFLSQVGCYSQNDTITPVDLNYTMKDSKYCEGVSAKSKMLAISDVLKINGIIYNLTTDDWYFDDTYLWSVFNKAYKTGVFDQIKCSRKMYYSSLNYDAKSDWIQIKEWVFSSPQDAQEAFKHIKQEVFNSDYFGPRHWDCIVDSNTMYFICGGSEDFWPNYHDYVLKNIEKLIR